MLAYHASRDLVPLYSVYALLFRDHGVDPGHLSLLFIIWSVTSFACEVPSGAWADTHDRRDLLVLSALVHAGGFALWLLWPTFAGFALGFVAWGLSSALMSGTFEALLYDELQAQHRVRSYARLVGWARSSAMLATLAAAGLAAVLFPVGGYALVGWSSVAVAGVEALLAATLPVSGPARRSSLGTDSGATETAAVLTSYAAMLRAGLSEVHGDAVVRRATVLAALMVGFTAYDEYFPLVARDHHVATRGVPLLIGLTVVGQVVGTALAGAAARLSGHRLGLLMAAGAALVSVGATASPYLGFPAIAAGYGLLNAVMLAGEIRVQEVITGPARATVTSVLGVLAELVALAVFVTFALLARVTGFPLLVALLGVPAVAVATAVWRWLPGREDSRIARRRSYP